jgi:HEAT repeat protein
VNKRRVGGLSLCLVCFGFPLCGLDPPETIRARNVLLEGFRSKDPAQRRHALAAATVAPSDPVLRTEVLALLKDPNVNVRTIACGLLAEWRDPAAIAALKEVLEKDEVPEVVCSAAKALYALRDPAGMQALEEMFTGGEKVESSFIRHKAREFREGFVTPKSALLSVFRYGIGFVPVPGVIEGYSAIDYLTNDPEYSARASILLLLGATRNPDAPRLALRSLNDPEWSVRAAAIQALVLTRQVDKKNAILPLFDDKKNNVRYRAAAAWLRLSNPSAPRLRRSTAAASSQPAPPNY